MGGRPLDPRTRGTMEARFGHDFSSVRVHDDARAATTAAAINAAAFTIGQNVVFGAAEYAPATGRGRELIAHELAHTVQQRNGRESAAPLAPGSQLESNAAAAGRSAVNGLAVTQPLGTGGIGIARAPIDAELLDDEELARQIEATSERLKQAAYADRDFDVNRLAELTRVARRRGEARLREKEARPRAVRSAPAPIFTPAPAFGARPAPAPPAPAPRPSYRPARPVFLPYTSPFVPTIGPGRRSAPPPLTPRPEPSIGFLRRPAPPPSTPRPEPSIGFLRRPSPPPPRYVPPPFTSTFVPTFGPGRPPAAPPPLRPRPEPTIGPGRRPAPFSLTPRPEPKIGFRGAPAVPGVAPRMVTMDPAPTARGTLVSLAVVWAAGHIWDFGRHFLGGTQYEPASPLDKLMKAKVEPVLNERLQTAAPEAVRLTEEDPSFPVYANVTIDILSNAPKFGPAPKGPQNVKDVSFVDLRVSSTKVDERELLPAKPGAKMFSDVTWRVTYSFEIQFQETGAEHRWRELLHDAAKAAERGYSARKIAEGSHWAPLSASELREEVERERTGQPTIAVQREDADRELFVRAYIAYVRDKPHLEDQFVDAVLYLRELERRAPAPRSALDVLRR